MVWKLVGSETACDTSAGEIYLERSSKFLTSIDDCKTLCTDTIGCQSVTFFISGWCGLFSTSCVRTRKSTKAAAYHLTSNSRKDVHPSAVGARQERVGQSSTYTDDTDVNANFKGFVAEDQSTTRSPFSIVATVVGCSVFLVVLVAAVVASVFWRRRRRNQLDFPGDTADEYDVEQSQEDMSTQQTDDQQE